MREDGKLFHTRNSLFIDDNFTFTIASLSTIASTHTRESIARIRLWQCNLDAEAKRFSQSMDVEEEERPDAMINNFIINFRFRKPPSLADSFWLNVDEHSFLWIPDPAHASHHHPRRSDQLL
jgi:hypothetical protein